MDYPNEPSAGEVKSDLKEVLERDDIVACHAITIHEGGERKLTGRFFWSHGEESAERAFAESLDALADMSDYFSTTDRVEEMRGNSRFELDDDEVLR